MGWKGAVFGSLTGGFAGGTFGAVFGAYLGHNIEENIRRRIKRVKGERRCAFPSPCDPLSEAYRLLGVKCSASDEEVRRAYRELAKKYHPDASRARGLREKAAAEAADRMKRINIAWSEIKSARGI